ncbi:uncharacterized protein LOC122381174 [Amphibalanus amphitrite]|uniref:uncharacterized protein LOC122381174 n=1 Tax=Amphibalanus amphitrite TaxID=1232801 RepID=UPI001C904542|nr:uncharacterized protein LOC122381174 [Amphibalanus amphitrite]
MSLLAFTFVCLSMFVTGEAMDLTRVQRGSLYIRLPPPYSTRPSQCFDPQVNEYYNVDDTWTSPQSGCKLNTCVEHNGKVNVERYSCPVVSKSIDFAQLKKENIFCRQAAGDRSKAFPSCCPSLQCKHYVEGRLVPLPDHMYPTLR